MDTLTSLLILTSGDTVPDFPPGWEISESDGVWLMRFGDDWTYEAATREEARAECWRRFCEAEPEWSELLARLLGFDRKRSASRVMTRLFG